MFSAIQNIYDRVRFELPGVTDGVIALALFDALDEFCRRTDANRFVAAVPLLEGVNSYIIEFEYTVVVRVFTMTHLTLSVSGAEYDADEARLALIESPTATDALEPMYIHVSLAPKPGTDDPDDWMGELMWARYAGVLKDGTISKLAAQIAKPYSSQVKAMFHGRRFRNGMAQSKAAADTGNAPNGQGWRFPIIK